MIAAPAAAPRVAKKVYVRRETGLGLLSGRSKIDRRQLVAGERYHRTFALLELAACSPIKSNLAQPETGGIATSGGLPAAAEFLSEREVLAARTEMAAVRGEVRLPYLVRALDVICGKQWTPGMVSPAQRDQEEIVTSLRIALDLLVDIYARLDKSN